MIRCKPPPGGAENRTNTASAYAEAPFGNPKGKETLKSHTAPRYRGGQMKEEIT